MSIITYVRGTTKRVSENFLASEFLCKGSGCCNASKIDAELVMILQKIRDHFGKPVNITSGYRCPTHNAKVGGATGSYHTYGQAADIVVNDTPPAEVAKYAESIGVLGIGLYDDFVHVDTRKNKSFWYGHGEEYRSTFGGAVQKPVESVENPATAALPMLRKGSKSDAVFAMQVLLAGYGYLRGMYVNGEFGEETETAVKDYQRSFDLDDDGICGPKTWSVLLGV